MKFKYFIGALFLAALMSCSHSESHNGSSKDEDEHGHEESAQQKSDEIVFAPEKAKKFGVVTKKIVPTQFNEIITVSGQVLPAQGEEIVIAAKSAGIVSLNAKATTGELIGKGTALGHVSAKNISGGDLNQAAYINYMAAKREYDRLTPLHKDRIVTDRDYNAARQEYERARAAYSSNSASGSGLVSPISGTITKLFVTDGQFVDAGAPIAQVSKNSKLVLRTDLPDSYVSASSDIVSVNFKPSYSETVYSLASLGGRKISGNSYTSTTPGYIPIYFEFNNKASFVSGSYVEAYLIGRSKPNCMVVPVDAITEQEGLYFVYAKIDAECYTKHEVKLGSSDGKNIEILSGIKPGEEIVTKGAILIKLASQSGSVPGHTHEH